jgi:hypothetical protein
MWLRLIFPELEAISFWDSARGCPDIGNNELNRACCQELSDIFTSQESPTFNR